jgi:hypothetical protein
VLSTANIGINVKRHASAQIPFLSCSARENGILDGAMEGKFRGAGEQPVSAILARRYGN